MVCSPPAAVGGQGRAPPVPGVAGRAGGGCGAGPRAGNGDPSRASPPYPPQGFPCSSLARGCVASRPSRMSRESGRWQRHPSRVPMGRGLTTRQPQLFSELRRGGGAPSCLRGTLGLGVSLWTAQGEK